MVSPSFFRHFPTPHPCIHIFDMVHQDFRCWRFWIIFPSTSPWRRTRAWPGLLAAATRSRNLLKAKKSTERGRRRFPSSSRPSRRRPNCLHGTRFQAYEIGASPASARRRTRSVSTLTLARLLLLCHSNYPMFAELAASLVCCRMYPISSRVSCLCLVARVPCPMSLSSSL